MGQPGSDEETNSNMACFWAMGDCRGEMRVPSALMLGRFLLETGQRGFCTAGRK